MVMYSVTISIIIKILISNNKFELFKIYNNNILTNFKIRTIVNVFFNLFNFTYLPISAIAITLINVPRLMILLILETDFPNTGYERRKYYPEPIEIYGDKYFVCSQWIPERIAKLNEWYNSL